MLRLASVGLLCSLLWMSSPAGAQQLCKDKSAKAPAKAEGKLAAGDKHKKDGDRLPVMVAVGDSITAGFADATLVEEKQQVSYPALIAKQMNIPFGQPYITRPGLPWLGFRFDRKARILELPIAPPFFLGGPGRKDKSNDNVHNFAVPNAKVWEVLCLDKKVGSDLKKPANDLDRLFEVILQGKGTQVEQARAKQPDLILVWIGNNDVLSIVAGAPDDKHGQVSYRLESRVTPLSDF